MRVAVAPCSLLAERLHFLFLSWLLGINGGEPLQCVIFLCNDIFVVVPCAQAWKCLHIG